MAEKIIAASLQVNTGNSAASVNEVNKSVNALDTSLKNTQKEADKTGQAIGGTSQHFGKLKDQLTAVPGPLGQAAGGVNTLSTAFKAMLANPVVLVLTAIVGVLALLYKAFTNTFAGGQKVEQIFAGIKAAGQSLLDNLDRIGSAIVKLFSFDFSGAVDEIKGVANAAAEAYNAMAKLTAEAQKLKKEQLQNDLEGAERAKKLAILREQATDDTIPLAKRKAALKELQADAEQNAKDDIDLARRVAENKIAQLTLEKDGALKNAEEINRIRIEQINGETDNANELRRINKQITGIEKEEQAQRKAARDEAIAKQKEDAQKLLEYVTKLRKLQQDNELATFKDGFEKEQKALEFKITEEKRINEQAFKDKKLTKDQYNQIDQALDIQAQLQRDALAEKYNLEKAKKEEDFQKELAKIRKDTTLAGITDQRQLERTQLQIGYEEKLQDAIARYKDDAAKLQAVRDALAEQQRVDDAKLQEKYRQEDEKKKLEEAEKAARDALNNPENSFDAKRAALDAEQEAFQRALDQKVLSEAQYNEKVKVLSKARKDLDAAEKESKLATFGAVGNAFTSLSGIIGKQTAVGKGLAAAGATISAIQSAVNSFNSLSSIPIVGPALGAVAAAAALASGYANVKKIYAVQVPGTSSSSGGSVPTADVPKAPLAPTQVSTTLPDSVINSLSEKTAAGVSGRAFVVDSDIRDASGRNERLERASRLGG